MTVTSPAYRPDIDGLRALAVMGVLIFHLDERILPGGFVGVDVFLVISGFLITGIIRRDLGAGTFSLVRFYGRRIRRILPALFAMIVIVLVASSFLLLPQDLVAVADAARYAVFGFSNIHFLQGAEDYFNDSVARNPLLHTWSLGVEEQFYLVFPVLLLALHRWVASPRRMMIILGILFAASLLASARVVPSQPMKGFFLLHFRAWELLLGALLASIGPARLGRIPNNMVGLAGVAMIAGSMCLFDGGTTFPGLSALIPCLGAAAMIYSGARKDCWTGRLFSLKPLVFLGLISYSVYLWHWPLISLVRYWQPFGASAAVLVFLASLIGGYFSWRFIERPFRNPRVLSHARDYSVWAAASLVLLLVCLGIGRFDGFESLRSAEVRHYLSFKEKHWRNSARNEEEPEKGLIFGVPGEIPEVALWGDSHGSALVPGLIASALKEGESFIEFGQGGLPPVVGVVTASDQNPEERLWYSEQIFDFLISTPSIHTVILHARWSLYSEGENEAGNPSPERFFGHPAQTEEELRNFYGSRIKFTVERLLEAGKRITLIYPIPEPGVNVPDLLAKQAASDTPVASTVAFDGFYERHGFVIRLLDSLEGGDRIIRIRPHVKLLNDGLLTVRVKRDALYADDDHLSAAGALHLKGLYGEIFGPVIPEPE